MDPATGGQEAECAFVTVPLDHARPAGERFRLFVKRRPAEGPTRAQVWLIDGGPSAAASSGMETLSGGIWRDRPGVAHYAVDHRGTGGSERLDCPGISDSAVSILTDPADVEACGVGLAARLGTRLNHVTLTASVQDLGRLIEAYREPDVPVFVYGASYGTIFVQRYLELFPNQPDGVIIEAIATHRFLDGYDAGMERTGQRVMALCAADPACGNRFEQDPWVVAQQAVAGIDAGRCDDLDATSADVRVFLGSMLFWAPLRDLIPATVYRLDRCAPADVAALSRLAARLSALLANDAEPDDVLAAHIYLSEAQPVQERAPQLLAAFQRATMSTGLEAQIARIDTWPRSTPGLPLGPPPYDGPMLMLQGGLDGPTPAERAQPVRDAYRGPAQTWAFFPTGAHGMTGLTPTPDGRDCARDIRIQFLDAPNRPPDLGCIDRILPIDWDGTPELNRFLFGTSDLWGNG
ncbi:serine aminopeptidase domain-containing protein [Tateyamaria omphalii]|uniref:Serine aminopeptidase S33 domain-containing protein n=1 Tax=Tateyamaria omphalii TaxID=299262 RepID=A0A1P8MW57_9RHOB|nr:alpha/beta hydrolase [Tateyamaria omphalii]APX12337.1 hypothetical protein BWR18_12100 [Tateyamaria omphalii]